MCSVIEYSTDVEVQPKHLDVNFFQEVIENALHDALIKIVKITISMGSSTGENYCSQIYRVCITYLHLRSEASGEEKKLSVIIKSIPRTEASQFMLDLQMYLKEKITYHEVLPRMEILLPYPRTFAPKLLLNMKEPENTLVFEDLAQRGFVMASRESGLDEAHGRLVMQRLAEFHAASMALGRKDTAILNVYREGLLGKAALLRENSFMLQFFSDNIKQLHTLVSTWPGYERIAAKIKKFDENLLENFLKLQAPRAGEIKVLNHGDLWVNNMLLKYNEQKKPQDIIFIDFQLGVWGSPGIDINYFFYTSLELDVLKHKRDDLIKEYHSRLYAILCEMNLKAIAPSYEQILNEVNQRLAFGFFANFGVFPIVSQDKENCSDSTVENFADKDFGKKKVEQMFASKRLKKTFEYTLKYFETEGVI